MWGVGVFNAHSKMKLPCTNCNQSLEIPDEFLDPVMCTLMTDPVKLPGGASMDRANIMRHLLSDQSDPFTRAPCSIEDLVDDVELKGKIDAWVRERKGMAAVGRGGA